VALASTLSLESSKDKSFLDLVDFVSLESSEDRGEPFWTLGVDVEAGKAADDEALGPFASSCMNENRRLCYTTERFWESGWWAGGQ